MGGASKLAVLAIGVAVLACGIPLKVRRVGVEGAPAADPTSERGVRFRIARPAFHVSLLRDETRSDRVVLSQRLDGPSLVYEAETRTNPFADTEIRLGLGEDALLQSVSAGETDRSLEVVEAVLALSKAAAAFAGEPGALEIGTCERARELAAAIRIYAEAQDLAIREREHVLALERECRSALLVRSSGRCGGLAGDDPRLLTRITALHKEAERRQAELREARFDLDPFAEVRLGDRVVKAVSDPCVVIGLEPVL